MRRLAARFLLVAALAALAAAAGGRATHSVWSGDPEGCAATDAEAPRAVVPEDSTARSVTPPPERPVYDPDIYDEETTIYAFVKPATRPVAPPEGAGAG